MSAMQYFGIGGGGGGAGRAKGRVFLHLQKVFPLLEVMDAIDIDTIWKYYE